MGHAHIWKIDPAHPAPASIEAAAELLRKGKLIAFPTETVYGLGANALDPDAVARIFTAKGRPQDNPLILHLAHLADLDLYARNIPPVAYQLAQTHWPGPLTLILPKSKRVPGVVTAQLPNVALRIPAHPVARALIQAVGTPLAAPSANTSGRPSPTTADHVREDLGQRIAGILDAGAVPIGLESTVLDLTTPTPTLLRPGGISLETLRQEIGEVVTHRAVQGRPSDLEVAQSPGMKYRHYAPEAQLWLVEGRPAQVQGWLDQHCQQRRAAGEQVGLMVRETTTAPEGTLVRRLGPDLENIARDLYRNFRDFNQAEVDIIFVEAISDEGLGLAIMNRIRKAAHTTITLE